MMQETGTLTMEEDLIYNKIFSEEEYMANRKGSSTLLEPRSVVTTPRSSRRWRNISEGLEKTLYFCLLIFFNLKRDMDFKIVKFKNKLGNSISSHNVRNLGTFYWLREWDSSETLKHSTVRNFLGDRIPPKETPQLNHGNCPTIITQSRRAYFQ